MKYSEFIHELKDCITTKPTEEDKKESIKEFKQIRDVILFLIVSVLSLVLPMQGLEYVLNLFGVNNIIQWIIAILYGFFWFIFIFMYLVVAMSEKNY